MAEYIEREAYCNSVCKCNKEQCDKNECPIWTAPAADVVEVVNGEWVDKQNPQWKAYDIRHCSMCGWNIPKSKLRNKDLHWNYCPYCGAKMDGERKDNG